MSDLHSSSSWVTSTLPEPSSLSTPPLLRPVPFPPSCTSSPSPEPRCEDGTTHDQLAVQQNAEKNCTSPSCGPCHGGSKPVYLSSPDMASVPERVISLQQHLQHAGIGREEAMQSFILERFLPAAKAVATDHDRTFYVATKRDAHRQSNRPKQSDTPSHMYISKSTRTTPWPQGSVRSTSTSSFSKGVPCSSPLSQEGGGLEYSDDEVPIKSNGFFCVGLKTAISRVHRVVHPSAQSMSRRKARAALLSNPDANAAEEVDVFPKVQISARGRQMQWNGYTTASYTSSSTSPMADNTHHGSASRLMAVPHRNGLPQSCMGGDGEPSGSPISLDGGPICHSASDPSHGYTRSSPNLDQSYGGCLSDRCSAGDHSDSMAKSPGGSRLEDASPVQNTLIPSCTTNDATRESLEGSIVVHCDAEIHKSAADSIDDDDEQFHDALDSWSSIAAASSTCPPPNAWSSNAGAPLTCPSPNCPDITQSTRNWVSDKDGVVDIDSYGGTPHMSDITGGISGCNTKSEGRAEYVLEPCEAREKSKEPGQSSGGGSASAGSGDGGADEKQKHGKFGEVQEDQGQEGSPPASNETGSAKPSSPASLLLLPIWQSHAPARRKNCASPPKMGWPLGMSGFKVATKKPSPPPEETDRAHLVPISTESSVPSSPPVLSSPTAGSWLGKAMAINASKPSALATLQQKQRSVSARKKLEFMPSDKKKSVKWEDVVKGSQIHPEEFSFTEELRHHRHPSNRNVLRPLRL